MKPVKVEVKPYKTPPVLEQLRAQAAAANSVVALRFIVSALLDRVEALERKVG